MKETDLEVISFQKWRGKTKIFSSDMIIKGKYKWKQKKVEQI